MSSKKTLVDNLKRFRKIFWSFLIPALIFIPISTYSLADPYLPFDTPNVRPGAEMNIPIYLLVMILFVPLQAFGIISAIGLAASTSSWLKKAAFIVASVVMLIAAIWAYPKLY
jgi:hypothetical protein